MEHSSPLLQFSTPSFALQGVSRDPRGPAAADKLCRQTKRLALRLVFKVPDEFLAKAESRILGKHVGTKVRGNILGAPPRDVHGEFEEVSRCRGPGQVQRLVRHLVDIRPQRQVSARGYRE